MHYSTYPFECASHVGSYPNYGGGAIWSPGNKAWNALGYSEYGEVFPAEYKNSESHHSYEKAAMNYFTFVDSATTVFHPFMVTIKKSDGNVVPFAICTDIRITPTTFYGPGDKQLYQGKNWHIFNHRESKGVGFAFMGGVIE